jgi:hypothetical protein
VNAAGGISALGVAKNGREPALRSQIDFDSGSGSPIGRYLQDSGATQPTMRDQHLFAKLVMTGTGHYLSGDTGQIAIVGAVFASEQQGNERRAGWLHFQSKLLRHLVPERRGSCFGDRETSGGNHENWSGKLSVLGGNNEIGGAADFAWRAIDDDLHSMCTTFPLQHVGDVVG